MTYGYCLEIFKTKDHFLPTKSGAISGFNSFLMYDRDRKIFIAAAANLDNSNTGDSLILLNFMILDTLEKELKLEQ
jgi:hypothetical protein